MKVRLRLAVPLLILGALAVAEVRPETSQAPGPVPAPRVLDADVTLRVIVVKSAEEAERIVARLNSGENFVALAKAESIDPTAGAGGLLGRVTLSILPAFLKDALQGVKPGQLSPVVRIPTGFAILKVVDDTDPANINMNAPAAAGTANGVKYVIDLSGLVEAEALVQAFPKPADWNQDPRAICQARRQSLASSQKSLEDFLSLERAGVGPSRPPFDVMQAHFALGQLHAYQGQMDRALDQYQRAYEVARAGVPEATMRMEEALGVAYLHRAEMDNGAYRAPGEIGPLPVEPSQPYARTRDSERAVEHFLGTCSRSLMSSKCGGCSISPT